MDLEHSFSVPVGVDEAWTILLDPERVARLLPGATVKSAEGDRVSGAFKVKLGPVNLTYRGSASIVEKDDLARRAVLTAAGTDARHGDGSATITAVLKDEGESTTVSVTTNLDLTGKPAQFGHSVMADVGNKLLGQFAAALAADLGADEPTETAPAYSTPPAADEPAAEAPPPAAKARPKPSRAARPAVDGQPTQSTTHEPAAETNATEAAPAADATPAYSVPGGGIGGADEIEPFAEAPLVNGSSPADRDMVRDLADAEPMQLIKSAGPALGKRLAGPAAVALVIVLLAARRRQRD